MAIIIDLLKDKEKKPFLDSLQKAIQSTNLNFLIGAGCSSPAIKTLGDKEKEIYKLEKSGNLEKVNSELRNFLKPITDCMESLINQEEETNLKKACDNYYGFLKSISLILHHRKSSILPKRATIFTTNYDLFIEQASSRLGYSSILNDGFFQNTTLSNDFEYSSRNFFKSVYNTGTLYQYKVQIPMINLVKIHGSLNWKFEKTEENVSTEWKITKNTELSKLSKKDIDQIIVSSAIVLPRKNKFQETVLNHTFYELLRIYSNELDKNNTLLLAEGFSFSDEHILLLTKRALNNPTLKLIIFCFNEDDKNKCEALFPFDNNVELIYRSKGSIGFKNFVDILNNIIPDKNNE